MSERDRVPADLAIPPPELRQLVGPIDPAAWDNPTRAPIYPDLPPEVYRSVFDFGCGCGRLARQLILQVPRPERYVGVDIHRGMIEWCRANLSTRVPGFEFHHQDVYNPGLNPYGAATGFLPFPIDDEGASLVIAHSVFTHLLEEQVPAYLREVERVLTSDGAFVSTWFLFDKRSFPMMQSFQNALYINHSDPTNAVIFDRDWLLERLTALDLVVAAVRPPAIRGFHWVLTIRHGPGEQHARFPSDTAPLGRSAPPLMPPDVQRLGLEARSMDG